MSTFVAFAGNLIEDPQLLYTSENKPFISCRVLLNRRVTNDEGEWIDAEPTARNFKISGFSVNRVIASAASGAHIAVQGLVKTGTWTDKEAQRKRTKDVVVVDTRFGDVALPPKFASARIDRPAACAVAG